MARSSTKIGIVLLLVWVIPMVGIALAIVGLLLAILARNEPRSDLVRAGIFLNSLGLSLSLMNVSVSLYLFLSGIIDPFAILGQLN